MMAYFPNGTAGEFFTEQWCMHCRNWRERPERPEVGEGCPVYDLHILLDQYKCCNADPSPNAKDGGDRVTKFVLDFLIADESETTSYDCAMYVPRGEERPDPNQLEIPLDAQGAA